MNTYIMNKIFTTMLFCAATTSVAAQTDFNSINEDGDFRPASISEDRKSVV